MQKLQADAEIITPSDADVVGDGEFLGEISFYERTPSAELLVLVGGVHYVYGLLRTEPCEVASNW